MYIHRRSDYGKGLGIKYTDPLNSCDEGGPRRQRYSFTDGDAFLMTSIWYPHEGHDQLVTLTTKPNKKRGEIHNRMLVIIGHEHMDLWFNGNATDLASLMDSISSAEFKITQQPK